MSEIRSQKLHADLEKMIESQDKGIKEDAQEKQEWERRTRELQRSVNELIRDEEEERKLKMKREKIFNEGDKQFKVWLGQIKEK